MISESGDWRDHCGQRLSGQWPYCKPFLLVYEPLIQIRTFVISGALIGLQRSSRHVSLLSNFVTQDRFDSSYKLCSFLVTSTGFTKLGFFRDIFYELVFFKEKLYYCRDLDLEFLLLCYGLLLASFRN